MFSALLFFIELFALFLISTVLTKNLSLFLYRITKNQKWTISLIAFIFLPGTFIHEVSHFLMAKILFVQAGNMEFMPKMQGNSVKLGSVAIAQTDIFRRLLIGMSPFLVGTTLLLGILYMAVQYDLFQNLLFILGIGYAVFEIGNTMFSSKKDMEGALELLVVILVLVGIFYLLGFKITAINPQILFSLPIMQTIFQKGTVYLAVPLVIDTLLIISFRILTR